MVVADEHPFASFNFPQRVPRPERRERAGVPSWVAAGIDPSWATFNRVRDALKQLGLAPVDQPPTLHEFFTTLDLPELKESAVLVVVCPEDDEAALVITRRSLHLRTHRGELAFPGGRRDAGETLAETALREAREEVGLRAEDVEVLGWLSPLVTLASSSAIWPLVALSSVPLRLEPNSEEVDDVFTLTLPWLLHPEHAVVERWWRPSPRASEDGSFLLTFFRAPHDLLWGASARIADELLALLTTEANGPSAE